MIHTFEEAKAVAEEIVTAVAPEFDGLTEEQAIIKMTDYLVMGTIKSNSLRVLAFACANLAISAHRGTLPGTHKGNRCGCPDCVDTAPCAGATYPQSPQSPQPES